MKKVLGLCAGLVLLALSGRVEAGPMDFQVSSSRFPVRVFCDAMPTCERALPVLEQAWQTQIVQMGYPQPLRRHDGYTGDIENGFDVVVADYHQENWSVTFDILGDNPATPAADCPMIGKVEATLIDGLPGYLDMLVAHVLNHGSLHAIDCLEPSVPTNDLVTGAIVVMTCGDPTWTNYCLRTFQRNPWQTWTWVGDSAATAFYSFGSALFPLFLEQHVGRNDGSLLLSAWRRAAQDGSILTCRGEQVTSSVYNEPTFETGLAAELQARGTTFDDAYTDFAVWRYFVGADDDGAHFTHGSDWRGDEVAREATLTAASLPVRNAGATHDVEAYASGYVALDPAGLPEGQYLHLELAGDPARTWRMKVILVPMASGPATVVAGQDDGHGTLAADVDAPSSYRRIVMVAVSLGGEDLGAMGYAYTLVPADAPQVTGATPADLVRGRAGQAVTLHGRGFAAGATLTVGGTGVDVTSATVVDATTITAVLSVSAEAALGPRDVTVRQGTRVTTGTGVLNVVEAPVVPPAGCSCATQGPVSDGGRWALPALLLALASLRRRPRRAR